MLPFLKRKNESGIASQIIQQRNPDESQEDKQEYSLEDCAKKIIEAIKSDSASQLADALKEAFEKMEQEPHEEGPHIQPHSYEAQKEE